MAVEPVAGSAGSAGSSGAASPTELGGDAFDAAVAAPGLLLVDFWAAWCGPCRAMAPALEEFAAAYAGRVAVGKVNVDEEPELAARFGVQSIPTLLLFSGGVPVRRLVGARSFPQLAAELEEFTS